MTLYGAIKIVEKYLENNKETSELRTALFYALDCMRAANKKKKIVYAE